MSVKLESVEHLAEASLQPGLPVNEGEGELVVVGDPHHPPTSSLERDVTPNNDETIEEFVFRILREKILKLAILDAPVGSSSPSRELALRCRLVCRDWRDTINSIYHTARLPLFSYKDPFPAERFVEVKRRMEILKSFTSLFAPPTESAACSGVVPPVSFGFSLSFRRISWETKIEFEATALNSLRQLGRMLLKLNIELPHNSLEEMNCSSLDLYNLKHAEFHFENQINITHATVAPWKLVEDIVKAAPSLQTLIIRNDFPRVSAEMPELALPKSMEKLQLLWIRIPMWLIDIAPTLKNMRKLVLTIGAEILSRQEQVGHVENLLINKLSQYLEFVQLKELGWGSLSEDTKLSECTLSILKPMPNLRTLKLSICLLKLGELKSYKELLPSLTDLDVWAQSDVFHFPASWYTSPCSTLRRLRLHIYVYEGPSGPSLFSQEMLGTISRCFPNLNELEVESNKCADNNWQPILSQGFPNLRKLKMECWNVSVESRDSLVAAVSGIPLEEIQAILEGEKELEQVINNYQHCRSLRDLTSLEELRLYAYEGDDDDEEVDEDPRLLDIDSSVMIYSSFLRMPNLKKVVLSGMFQVTAELKRHAKDVTGLDIETY